MKQAHFICKDANGSRMYLGMNTHTCRPEWIHEAIVTKIMVDLYPLVYTKREYAEVSAAKIGDGAYALTINY